MRWEVWLLFVVTEAVLSLGGDRAVLHSAPRHRPGSTPWRRTWLSAGDFRSMSDYRLLSYFS